MIGKPEYIEINHFLNRKIAEKKCLIAVHRGSSAGNIIENTIPAYIAALKMGGDILEADVVLTPDHEIFHFHNGMEPKNFQQTFDIRECTASEMGQLSYVNQNLEKTEYPVEKLETTLNYFKDQCLINIDRAWDFFPEVCEVIAATGTEQQVILKGPMSEKVVGFLQESEIKFMFMPKVQTLAELSAVLETKNINVVGVEIKAETEADDFFQEENIQKIKKAGLFVWMNALTMNDMKKFFAGYDDNQSVIKNENSGWGVMLEKGATVIQTDWPSLLSKYRDQWLLEKR